MFLLGSTVVIEVRVEIGLQCWFQVGEDVLVAFAVNRPVGSQNEDRRQGECRDVTENLETFVTFERFCVFMIEPGHFQAARHSGAVFSRHRCLEMGRNNRMQVP